MVQVTKSNHYVPRGYLSRWSEDGKTIWEHKLVVPHPDFPVWRRAPLREACARRHLYSVDLPGFVRDYYEDWLNQAVETPGFAALARVETGAPVAPQDWESLVRLAVAQELRTVTDYERYDKWHDYAMQTLLDETITSAIQKYKPYKALENLSKSADPMDESGSVEVNIERTPTGAEVHLSYLTGAAPWMQRNKRMIREFTPKLLRHKWQLISPYPGRDWPTSDNPLIRFERRQGIAIHGTGWLRKGTEIFMPLTPHFALYTKVGNKSPVDPIVSAKDTALFIKLIISFANRSVYSARRDCKLVEWQTTRQVDQARYDRWG